MSRPGEGSGSEDVEGQGDRDDGDRSLSLGFSLPPISLPPVRLPERLAPHVPWLPGRRAEPSERTVLALALLVDVADAALVLSGSGEWVVRVLAGTALAAVFAGPPGLLYAWEGLAALGGVGAAAAFPSATALVLLRALR